MRLEHSRALLLAREATGAGVSALERRLERSLTVVSVAPDLPEARLTATVLLTTLRRLPGRLQLNPEATPPDLVDRLVGAVEAVDPERGITVSRTTPADPSVRLHIGSDAATTCIRVIPEGYGAHLLGANHTGVPIHRPANALGAVYAAALGAAEAFKHTAGVLPARRALHRHLRFCPVTISTDLDRAPDPPADLHLDLSLIGLGAVGTATAVILGQFPATGVLALVDPERYSPENRGTYSLGGARETKEQPWKVDLAASALTGYDLTRISATIEQYQTALEQRSRRWPRIVLAGLDSIEARHHAQRLWPDHLIDAATGDTMLGLHHVVPDHGPCLRCLLPLPSAGPSSLERLAQETGLPIRRLARGDEPLTEKDLTTLSIEQRNRLRQHLGKPTCGLANALGLTSIPADDYRPSVPFISQQAACLAVGRLLATTLGLQTRANFVQYDGLIGPRRATKQRRRAAPTCYCQTRAATIQRVRESRQPAKSST